MVWTDQIVADFLDYAAEHTPDLHPLLHFLAYRGPRRGEACGLLDSEVRLDQAEVSIVNQIAAHGRNTYYKKPKSESGNRDVILDADTVAVFTRYKAQRARWQLAAGPTWPDTGLFFVRRDGTAWHPDSVSARFRRLIHKGGFPPVRLHDLRHSAATIALQAGVDIKVGYAALPSTSRGFIHGPGNEGFIKVIADRERGVLIGATTAGPSGGEMIGALSVAVHAEVPIATLRSTIWAYPTFHRGIGDAIRALP